MGRPDWNDYFTNIAELAATRSTCLRRKVGAILVRNKRILATGYNGAPSGLSHCEETGCLREELGIPSAERQEICRGVHAEQNAIIQAAILGVPLKGSTLYSTNHPCVVCAKMLINAGIKEIVVKGAYPDKLASQLLKEAGVSVVKWRESGR